MKRLICGVICLFCLVPASAWALLGYEMEVAVGGYHAAPEGWVQHGPDEVDLEKHFGYDADFMPIARFKAEMPLFLPNLYANISPVSFDGDGDTGSFSFAGESVPSGFSSEFSLNQYDLTLFYHVPGLETLSAGILSVEFGVAGRFVDVEVTVKDAEGKETRSMDDIVPLLYAAGRVGPLAGFRIEAEVWGMEYDSQHWITAVGRLGYDVVGPLFLTAGYRYHDVEMKSGDFAVNTRFGGPFAELGFRF